MIAEFGTSLIEGPMQLQDGDTMENRELAGERGRSCSELHAT
jgi:hypothetical protein